MDPVARHLTDFVDDLRERGIEVSPSGLIDAGRAVVELDLLERNTFREALACTLLTDVAARPVFDVCFDLWFPVRPASGAADQGSQNSQGAGTKVKSEAAQSDSDQIADVGMDAATARELLAEVLAQPPDDGDLRLKRLVSQVVGELGSYQARNGEAFSTYQAVNAVDATTLIAGIAAAMAKEAGDDDPEAGRQARYRRAAHRRVKDFTELVSAETTHRMALRNGRERVAEYAVPTLAEDVTFVSAGAADMATLRTTIEPLARLLATRLERRRVRAHLGPVDIRRTLRASMATGGVPIALKRRKPRIGRPELVVLCDVSGSVASFSRFTLQLVYALSQQFSKVRVFAFVDTVAEVTDLFDQVADHSEILAAADAIIKQAPVSTRGGHSDYGHVFRGFASDFADSLTHRCAVLILGDGRTNFGEPGLASLEYIAERARHVYWLNPEQRAVWGTGDSAALRYQETVPMYECCNARQLGDVIGGLLPV